MNFITRTLGGIAILLVLLLMTFFGHNALSIGLTVFSVIATKEMANALSNIDLNPSWGLLIVCDLIIMIGAYSYYTEFYTLAIIFSIVLVLVYMTFNHRSSIEDVFASLFILMYVPVFMGNILRITDQRYVWMLYISAWGSDTFAYLVGSLIGKHKLSTISHISPNKTIEGSIGGIIGAVVLNLIYTGYSSLSIPTSYVVIFSIIAAFLSQVGDLVASFIKRKTKIKDFGDLIPGHGGIMDRFDSMIFIAPLLYLLSII